MGLQRVANPAYIGGFLCSGLLSAAPYCVPGGIRVVSSGVDLSVRESAHNAQATQAAVRALIRPSPRPCSLAPTVIPLLYSTTVS
jgi:hypothetical protein